MASSLFNRDAARCCRSETAPRVRLLGARAREIHITLIPLLVFFFSNFQILFVFFHSSLILRMNLVNLSFDSYRNQCEVQSERNNK